MYNMRKMQVYYYLCTIFCKDNIIVSYFKNLYNHARFKERNNILHVKEQDISITSKLLNICERKIQIFDQIKLFLKLILQLQK